MSKPLILKCFTFIQQALINQASLSEARILIALAVGVSERILLSSISLVPLQKTQVSSLSHILFWFYS